jgi:hypothetical protein
VIDPLDARGVRIQKVQEDRVISTPTIWAGGG